MWRLQNDMAPISRIVAKREEQDDNATYTEFKLDVHGESPTTSAASLRKF